jgi:hypothetical protein
MCRAVWLTVLALSAVACHESAPEPEPPPPAVDKEPLTETEVDCHAMCDAAVDLGCEDPSCAARCVSSVEAAGDCQQVTQDYVGCLGQEGLESCFEVPAACDQAYADWKGCEGGVEGSCGPVTCNDPGAAACECEATCGGAQFVERCYEAADGYDCECLVDGEVAVQCSTSATACAFFIGCCSLELNN